MLQGFKQVSHPRRLLNRKWHPTAPTVVTPIPLGARDLSIIAWQLRLGSFEETLADLRTTYDIRKTLASNIWVAMRLSQSASGLKEEDLAQIVYR